MKATDIKGIQFYSGTFKFDGKLGSYKVKEHKFKPIDIEPKVTVTDGSLFVGSLEASVTKVTIKVNQGLRYFGGGEQFSHVELTGKKVPFIVEENGIGPGRPACNSNSQFSWRRWARMDYVLSYSACPFYRQ